MKTELKINVTTILVLVAGVVLFFWLNSNYNKKLGASADTIAQHEWTIEQKTSEVDGMKVAHQQALAVKDGTIREYLANDSIQKEQIAYYKNLSQVVKYEYIYETDTIEVPVPIYVEKDTTIHLTRPCFEADLSFKTGLFTLDGFSFDNRQDIVIGEQKTGFRRTETFVSIRNTNPCITATGMESYNIVYEKKWWENPLIVGGISATAGFIGGMIVNR
jgi:hypothetical protein